MKHIYLIFLTILLLQIGGGGFFLLWQSLQKYKIQSTEHSKNSQYLHLSQQDFDALDWEEKGKEFLFQGKRYDVQKITFQAERYEIACINDIEEEKIVLHLKSQYNDNEDNSSNPSKIKYPFWEYFFHTEKGEISVFSTQKKPVFGQNEKAFRFYPASPNPPPQV